MNFIIIKNILNIKGFQKNIIVRTEKREFIFVFKTLLERNSFLFMLSNCIDSTTGRPVYIHPQEEVVAKKLIVKETAENGNWKEKHERDTKFYEEQKKRGLELVLNQETQELQYSKVKPTNSEGQGKKGKVSRKKQRGNKIIKEHEKSNLGDDYLDLEEEVEEEEKTRGGGNFIIRDNELPVLKNKRQYKQNDRYKEVGDDSGLFNSELELNNSAQNMNIPKNNQNFKKNANIFEMNEDNSLEKEDPFEL